MTNHQLIQTICTLAPYGLQVRLNENGLRELWDIDANNNHLQGVYTIIGFDLKENLLKLQSVKYENYTLEEIELDWVSLLLHSTSKLTEPILEGGKVPIVELAKKSCPFDTSENSDFEFEEDTIYEFGGVDCWCNVLIHGSVVWSIEYRAISNSFHQLVEEAPNISYQQESFEFLIENHFNLFNLSEEYYVEKSTLKIKRWKLV